MPKNNEPIFFKEVVLNTYPYKLPSFPPVLLPDSPIRQLHYHDVFEIGYCFTGSGECQYNNTSETFCEGDAEFFYPYQSHFSRSHINNPSQWNFSYFDVSEVFSSYNFNREPWEALVETKRGIFGIIKRNKYPHICDCIKNIILTSRSKEKNKLIKCQLLIAQLLVYITEENNKDDKNAFINPGKTLKLMPAFKYIKQKFNEQITVSHLASLCYMSVSSFRENFSKETGLSPQEYIFATRMRYATHYLENSSLTIREICKRCGFSDTANFYKRFIKNYGVSPTEYRKSLNK